MGAVSRGLSLATKNHPNNGSQLGNTWRGPTLTPIPNILSCWKKSGVTIWNVYISNVQWDRNIYLYEWVKFLGSRSRYIFQTPHFGKTGEFMWVFPKNRGVSPQIIHLFIGFSIIFTIHFGGFTTPLFGSTPIFTYRTKMTSQKWGVDLHHLMGSIFQNLQISEPHQRRQNKIPGSKSYVSFPPKHPGCWIVTGMTKIPKDPDIS